MSNWRIFADGACSGNPGPGGWAAIILSSDLIVQEIGAFEKNTTNNRMELSALIQALRVVPIRANVEIFLDSKYVIEGATVWTKGWKRNGWLTQSGESVKNQDLWKELDALLSNGDFSIEWTYALVTQEYPGNERVDEIAQALSKGLSPVFYRGPLEGYSVDLYRTELSRDNQDQYPLYLSLVEGELEQHADWESCKSRVHGVPGARFKKVQSASERGKILKDWGL